MQRTEPERSATEQSAEENGPEPGSNPALGPNAAQPPNQNCPDDNDKWSVSSGLTALLELASQSEYNWMASFLNR